MQNITIGRYQPGEPTITREDGIEVHEVAEAYAGWIEGVRDDGTTWIMFMDAHGNPEVFWARRESDGGVIGDGVDLS